MLQASLAALGAAVDQAVAQTRTATQKLKAAAMSFFRFYAENPGDLDLGFYLFRGGMKPAGLGHERDEKLNSALEAALRPIADAAIELGASRQKANLLTVDCFAHATGLLLLLHTGRIRMFGASAPDLMATYGGKTDPATVRRLKIGSYPIRRWSERTFPSGHSLHRLGVRASICHLF